MLFKLKEGSRTRGHKAALVKEQCRLDMRKYSSSQTVITEWNKLSNDCVNGGKGGLYIDDQIVGLSISRWQNRAGQFSMTHVNNRTAGPVTSFFAVRRQINRPRTKGPTLISNPCPLAIWNLLFGMAILLNLILLN